MKTIFPKEILENTTQLHQFKHSKKSTFIYTTILIAIICAIASLPFIKIDIYATSRGIIKPEKERISVGSIYSGKVVEKSLLNN